ncbi:MAG: molecular chaperone DnaK, partial [Anaerotignum sp.]|nr:molecular chaperone DnaK [Anaerotignum sp.]
IFQTEKAMEEMGDKLDSMDKSTVEAELTKLKDAVKDMTPETMTEADTESVKAATESLKQEFYKLSEKLYAQAQAAQGGNPNEGPDVVDVDGKEI